MKTRTAVHLQPRCIDDVDPLVFPCLAITKKDILREGEDLFVLESVVRREARICTHRCYLVVHRGKFGWLCDVFVSL